MSSSMKHASKQSSVASHMVSTSTEPGQRGKPSSGTIQAQFRLLLFGAGSSLASQLADLNGGGRGIRTPMGLAARWISSSPNGGDYGAPSDTIGNNLRLLFAHTRLRCAR